MNRAFEERYFSGAELYGDDFDQESIARWYQQEEHAFFKAATCSGMYEYDWHGVNRLHGYSAIAGRHFRCCLALGCARGDDVAPIAPQVDEFVAIEPAEQWWSEQIDGTPARYLKPTVSGKIPLSDGTADLAVSLGVLHHIPNVTYVLHEINRVLSPGGIYLLREPICTMGDWRQPRGALTPNERGLPAKWLEHRLASLRFRVLRKRDCAFPGAEDFSRALGLGKNLNSLFVVRFDAAVSWLFRWNLHYHRDAWFKMIAPTSIFYVLEKP